MVKYLFLSLFVLCCALTSLPALADGAPAFKDAEYLALVDAAQKDPKTADWKSIRALYLKTSFYDDLTKHALSGMTPSNFGAEAVKTKTPEAIAAYKEAARKYAGSLEMQMQAYALLNRDKADFIDEAYTTAANRGLMAAVLATGDGHTMKTAIQVASVGEEYVIMRSYYNLTPKRQSLEGGDGHMYDVHRVSNAKGEDIGEIFFNIDLYFGKMEIPKAVLDKFKTSAAGIAPQKPREVVVPPENKEYLALVDAAMKDPASANWDAIRSHYPDTTFYKSVGGINVAHYSADMAAFVMTRMSTQAIDAYKRFQREHYAAVGAHATSMRLYKDKKPDFIDPQAEIKAYDGLLQSLRSSGDGKAQATAFKAVTLDEASYLAEALFSGRPALAIENGNGKKYVTFTGTPRDAKTGTVAYFEIDARASANAGGAAAGMPAIASVTVTEKPAAPEDKTKLLADPQKADAQKVTFVVMDLNGNGITLGKLRTVHSAYWDIDADGYAEETAWPDDALLGVDLNNDGVISGNDDLLAVPGANTFDLLKQKDDNHDGQLDARDAIWPKLLVWYDANHDGSCQPNEVFKLADLKVQSISLKFKNDKTVQDGNTIVSTGEFTMLGDDGKPVTHKMAAVSPAYDDANTVEMRPGMPGFRAAMLPQLRGYGVLGNLQQAIARDKAGADSLQTQVEELSALPLDTLINSPADYEDRVNKILYRWAGVSRMDPASRGPYFDARQLAVLEIFMGERFVQMGAGGLKNPLFWAALDLHQAYQGIFGRTLGVLAAQLYGPAIFTGNVTYSVSRDGLPGVQGLNIENLSRISTQIGRIDNPAGRKRAWLEIVRIIEFSVNRNAIPQIDREALDKLIAASAPGLTYKDLVEAANTVDMRSLPGNDYASKTLGISAADGDILDVARAARKKDNEKQIVYSDVATDILKNCCKSRQEVVAYLRGLHYNVSAMPADQVRKKAGTDMTYDYVLQAVWTPTAWDKVMQWFKPSIGFNMVVVFFNGEKVEWAYAHTQL